MLELNRIKNACLSQTSAHSMSWNELSEDNHSNARRVWPVFNDQGDHMKIWELKMEKLKSNNFDIRDHSYQRLSRTEILNSRWIRIWHCSPLRSPFMVSSNIKTSFDNPFCQRLSAMFIVCQQYKYDFFDTVKIMPLGKRQSLLDLISSLDWIEVTVNSIRS